MAILVETKLQFDTFEIIKYQIVQYCFVNKIWLNETEINCLSLLGESGQMQVSNFCKLVVAKKLLKNPIGVNTVLRRLIDKKFVIKQNHYKKLVSLNPELKIQSEGDIVINIKAFKLESKKTAGNIPDHSKQVEFA